MIKNVYYLLMEGKILTRKKKINFGFHAPLNPGDSATQTYGCRARVASTCKNYMMEDVCAFCRADETCLQPSRMWKKQFEKLKNESS